VEAWKEKCPIKRLGCAMVEKRLLTRAQLDAIDAAVASEMEAALRFAEESPEPDPSRVMDNVFFPSPTSGGQ
jgi:pyruvate dehydrogenase E1 component alpha subunit